MTHEKSVEERLLDAEEGELILIVSEGFQAKQNDPVLSVLDGYNLNRVYLTSPTIYLQPTMTVDGTIRPQVRRIGRKGYSTKKIHELYLGKSEVVEFCRRNDLDIHADWIENLREPYRIPVVSSVQWVSPEMPARLRKSDKW